MLPGCCERGTHVYEQTSCPKKLGDHSPPLPTQELSKKAPERRKMMEEREVRDLEINKEREKGINESEN